MKSGDIQSIMAGSKKPSVKAPIDLGGGVVEIDEKGTPPLSKPRAELNKGGYRFVDPVGLNEQVGKDDTAFYDRTRQAWEEENPFLAQSKSLMWDSVKGGIAGQQDPLVNNTLAQSGFSGMDFSKADMAVPGLKQRGRESFRQFLQMNPPKSIGMNIDNVLDISSNNSMGITDLERAQHESAMNSWRGGQCVQGCNVESDKRQQ